MSRIVYLVLLVLAALGLCSWVCFKHPRLSSRLREGASLLVTITSAVTTAFRVLSHIRN
jgi:hypothetical protein